jgi:hypothetical protein
MTESGPALMPCRSTNADRNFVPRGWTSANNRKRAFSQLPLYPLRRRRLGSVEPFRVYLQQIVRSNKATFAVKHGIS